MAYVTPLQKKPSLDRNILKNYRPVSTLSFISKLIEKVVAKQENEFISLEGLLNVNQSAYKSSHSTLLKIQNDIALSVDSGKAVALTLLHISAAFDMIGHSLLYDCLHDWFGLDGTVLSWIKSYLSNHKQKIKIGGNPPLSESPKALYWVLSSSPSTLVPSVKLFQNSMLLIT